MNVCFIYPTFPNWETWPPLALACLASFLRQHGHEVTIIDRNVLLHRMGTFPKIDQEMVQLLSKTKPAIIGITATTPLITDAFRCAGIARKKMPSARIILGGIHASTLPEGCLQECDALDYVCKGEGEFTLKELAEGRDAHEVNGLYFREEGHVVSTPPREFHSNLDDFPLPARDLLDMRAYLRSSASLIRGLDLCATHLFSGIGCTGNCHFCAWPGVHGRRVHLHSAEYVFREIVHLVDDYHVEGLYLAEEMFLCDKKRAAQLCKLLLDSGYNRRVKLCVQLRTDVITEERLELLRNAGFVQVEYGIESGSQRILDIMNKRTTVEQNRSAIMIAKKMGVRVLANVIVGTPGETKGDVYATMTFLRETKPDHVAVNRFVPLPGSYLFQRLKEDGRVSHNWMNYWYTDVETNYSDIDHREFIRLFLRMRAQYQVTNTLNSVKWNMRAKPSYILRAPYYIASDPLRFVYRRMVKKLRGLRAVRGTRMPDKTQGLDPQK